MVNFSVTAQHKLLLWCIFFYSRKSLTGTYIGNTLHNLTLQDCDAQWNVTPGVKWLNPQTVATWFVSILVYLLKLFNICAAKCWKCIISTSAYEHFTAIMRVKNTLSVPIHTSNLHITIALISGSKYHQNSLFLIFSHWHPVKVMHKEYQKSDLHIFS